MVSITSIDSSCSTEQAVEEGLVAFRVGETEPADDFELGQGVHAVGRQTETEGRTAAWSNAPTAFPSTWRLGASMYEAGSMGTWIRQPKEVTKRRLPAAEFTKHDAHSHRPHGVDRLGGEHEQDLGRFGEHQLEFS